MRLNKQTGKDRKQREEQSAALEDDRGLAQEHCRGLHAPYITGHSERHSPCAYEDVPPTTGSR